jgi:hypothetical protein
MEIKINKPTKYANSFLFEKETGFSYFQVGEDFFLVGDASEAELLAAFAAHNPPAPTEPTIADKLSSVGLSIDDLKTALGLGGN